MSSSRWDNPPKEPAPGQTDAAAAAAAAAAKIAAQLAPPGPASSSREENRNRPRESLQDKKADKHDAEFIHDIEINDQKNRYMLTKGQTQAMVHHETGASVTTKGVWYPDKSMATKEEPPLFLHISAISQEMLDKAIAKVEELMAQEIPQLIEDRHQKRLEYESQRPPPRERKKWPEEKMFVNLESLRNFNIRSKVVGPGGMFVKYIQSETGTRVQIKGQGSGFIESDTGRESDEAMHVSIAGPDEEQVKAAKVLADDLLDAVKTEWQKAKENLNAGFVGGAGGPAAHHSGYGGSQATYNGQQQAGYSQPGWGQQQQGWEQGYQGSYAQPPLPDGVPPPPPPEDEAPPPPPADGVPPTSAAPSSSSSSYHHHSVNQTKSNDLSFSASTSHPAQSPEEEALDKYWTEYKTWEDSFKAYHNRLPTKEEGGQELPSKYRK